MDVVVACNDSRCTVLPHTLRRLCNMFADTLVRANTTCAHHCHFRQSRLTRQTEISSVADDPALCSFFVIVDEALRARLRFKNDCVLTGITAHRVSPPGTSAENCAISSRHRRFCRPYLQSVVSLCREKHSLEIRVCRGFLRESISRTQQILAYDQSVSMHIHT